MTHTGGCRCGAIRWTATGTPAYIALCHCTECRRSAGAPMVGWSLFRNDQVTITGNPCDYESSPGTTRQFCGTCGTGLFYRNESIFPGQVDIQSATADAPEALAPQINIQMADAPGWVRTAHALPSFDRFPGK